MPKIVHVLYVKDENGWFAQCLDFDLASQGDTLEAVERAFIRTWNAQVAMDRAHDREPFAQVGQAPSEYWKMFCSVTELQNRQLVSDDGFEASPAFVITAHVNAARRSAWPT